MDVKIVLKSSQTHWHAIKPNLFSVYLLLNLKIVSAKYAAKFKVTTLQIPQTHVHKFVEMENFMIINVMMGIILMEMDAQKIVSFKKIGAVMQVV